MTPREVCTSLSIHGDRSGIIACEAEYPSSFIRTSSSKGATHTLTHRDQANPYKLREAMFLLASMQHVNELTNRKGVLNSLRGGDDFFNSRSIDVFIARLRKKLSKDPLIQIINMRGYGYTWVV